MGSTLGLEILPLILPLPHTPVPAGLSLSLSQKKVDFVNRAQARTNVGNYTKSLSVRDDGLWRPPLAGASAQTSTLGRGGQCGEGRQQGSPVSASCFTVDCHMKGREWGSQLRTLADGDTEPHCGKLRFAPRKPAGCLLQRHWQTRSRDNLVNLPSRCSSSLQRVHVCAELN